jgi:tetratricopeptide (TPR) repeat protein
MSRRLALSFLSLFILIDISNIAIAQTQHLTPQASKQLRHEIGAGQLDRALTLMTQLVNARTPYTTKASDDYIVDFALPIIAVVKTHNPKTKWDYLGYGSVQTNPERSHVVLEWCKQLVREYPQSPYSHLLLGSQYRSADVQDLGFTYEQKYNLAIGSFEEAIQQDPDLAEAYFYLANVYETAAMIVNKPSYYDRAIEYFQKAAERNSLNGRPFTETGMIQRAQGAYDGAIDSFQKAIAVNPSDDYPYSELAAIYLKVGNPDQAIKCALSALKLHPTPGSNLYYTLGSAYEQQGEYTKAIAAYQKFLANRGTGPDTRPVREKISMLQHKLQQ